MTTRACANDQSYLYLGLHRARTRDIHDSRWPFRQGSSGRDAALPDLAAGPDGDGLHAWIGIEVDAGALSGQRLAVAAIRSHLVISCSPALLEAARCRSAARRGAEQVREPCAIPRPIPRHYGAVAVLSENLATLRI
jgi:hypothetical protein